MTALIPTVTVYTLVDCPNCVRTLAWLRRHGIVHRVVRLNQDAEARAHFRRIGYTQAPVIVTSDGVEWSGWAPSLLAALLPDTLTDADTDTTTGAAGQAVRAAGRRDVTQRQVAAG